MAETMLARETADGQAEEPTSAATETPAATPEPTALPTVTPRPTVEHQSTPGSPNSVTRFLTDVSSASTGPDGAAPGEIYADNILERPFTAQDMQYLPYLDLTRGELDAEASWFYVSIELEARPSGQDAHYGVELDLDGDGSGDWLIYGELPESSDWTTQGVRAYRDANDDVGGSQPMRQDSSSGDGYEEMVFDHGYGEGDPDAAWIRLAPNGNRVQLAFKRSLIGANSFLWAIWSDAGPQDPSMFDYHDRYTLAEAGSPLANNSNYPLQQLAAVDNSCRDAYNFSTTGQEPGLCIIPGSISGVVWKDRCLLTGGEGGEPLVLGRGCEGTSPDWRADGVYEPEWEPGIGGVTVDLGSGSCPSSGLATSTTDSAGRYRFDDLQPGNYCVSVALFSHGNDGELIPGGWSVPDTGGDTTAAFTVQITSGQNRTDVNFGWTYQFGD
ncbi:MAG: SdrD B-like domain-containing protein [Anaerolineales bacterium]